MLHVATAHRGSSRWIAIQREHLQRHVGVPFLVWGSLAGVQDAPASSFDRVIAQKGPEHGKLNHLAVEIAREAAAEDLLMFLEQSAFPIADPMPAIEQALARAPLLAVRRDENFAPQPDPCFCVTTVGAWRRLAGDWSDGYAFASVDGERATAPGANLLRRLQLSGTPWVPLLRSNPQRREDPLMFAIYGGVLYRHGGNEVGAAHRRRAPRLLSRRQWERRVLRRSARSSEQMYEAIAAGGEGWLARVR